MLTNPWRFPFSDYPWRSLLNISLNKETKNNSARQKIAEI